MKKYNYSKAWKRLFNYLKWGYSNYVGVAIAIGNTIMLLKGLFFQEVSIFIIAPTIIISIVIVTSTIGWWDYHKGTYPELAIISTMNSPPAVDSYKAMLFLLESLPESEARNERINNLKRWVEGR
jgi:hypothetical protein